MPFAVSYYVEWTKLFAVVSDQRIENPALLIQSYCFQLTFVYLEEFLVDLLKRFLDLDIFNKKYTTTQLNIIRINFNRYTLL
ncbi:uncharacterized protein BO96DRAFT_405091 [Aspergillus niger CBS 101883]|uniref:Uncharacterized protein n=2 Tax=Aspergillus niger TaxID=5061 RepID=A2R9S2_ASPNC|nr:uncharacterized protein BO96DRAFT_405091 [Aspergillus niger CBS 101883]XP_059606822.1 hypothetical protein An17g02400 [Aspergillus niger]PYH50859.1 hypothetical protein BO96DRAFT_405091 [Aspergillus niger CBS 101883]CAL00585.1 hypothetical protein An17g02400 [Aspergillus niger]